MLFTGKGGVGKSSLVAGLALQAAALGLRPLIVELGHRASMEGLLAGGPIGPTPTKIVVHPPIWALNIDPQRALEDTIYAQLKVRRLARGIRKNRLLQRLFAAAPAVRELITLDTIARLERARTDNRPRWSPILIDLDATGHALMFLDLPRVMRQLLAGPLRTLVDDATELFADPLRTALCLVTLPGTIPVSETIDLCRHLERCEVPPHVIFANRVPAPALPPRLEGLFRQLQTTCPKDLLPKLTGVEHRIQTRLDALSTLGHLRQTTGHNVVELGVVAADRQGLLELGRQALRATQIE